MPPYLTAIWAMLALLGSLVGATMLAGGAKSTGQVTRAITPTLTLKTSPIAVPIFTNRKVDGYVITQVRYLPDSAFKDPTSSPMEVVMRNALHVMVYRDDSFDRADYPNRTLEELAEELKVEVNELFGFEAVRSLSLEYAYYAPFGSPEMNDPSSQQKR